MMEQQMKYGARKGGWNVFRRWAAKALSHELRIFPVPGADILRAYGLHLEQRACKIASTPREANVLLLAGPISEMLAEKAAVAYAQIPRPRVLAFIGLDEASPLPQADVVLSKKAENLEEEIRKVLLQHAWSDEAEPFATQKIKEAVEDKDEDHGHMHHEHGESEHQQHKEQEGDESEHQHQHDEHQHAHHHHEKEQDEHQEEHDSPKQQSDDHSQHEGHAHHQENDGEGQEEEGGHQDEGHEHHQHQHGGGGGHDHGGGGFMSMVAMTKDMPRSMDGLAMEMNPAHFGPFFSGLPGGLNISMMLDGDTVMQAEMEQGLLCRKLNETFPSAAEAFVEHMASINPLAPIAFRVLAAKALANALSLEEKEQTNRADLLLLEKERVLSHLNWLAVFSQTLGNPFIHKKAVALHRQYQKGQENEQDILNFTKQINNIPYLKKRLLMAGNIPKNLLHHTSGPVARSAGIQEDVRMHDKSYQDLSFSPTVYQQNNAWGRLQIRLAEINQSLQLLDKLNVKENATPFSAADYRELNGKGKAYIETPRGKAALEVNMQEGEVKHFHLSTASVSHAAFIPQICEGQELSDALLSIASLDISPWEVDV